MSDKRTTEWIALYYESEIERMRNVESSDRDYENNLIQLYRFTAQRLRYLQSVIDELPVTDDDYYITPGMTLYTPYKGWKMDVHTADMIGPNADGSFSRPYFATIEGFEEAKKQAQEQENS